MRSLMIKDDVRKTIILVNMLDKIDGIRIQHMKENKEQLKLELIRAFEITDETFAKMIANGDNKYSKPLGQICHKLRLILKALGINYNEE